MTDARRQRLSCAPPALRTAPCAPPSLRTANRHRIQRVFSDALVALRNGVLAVPQAPGGAAPDPGGVRLLPILMGDAALAAP